MNPYFENCMVGVAVKAENGILDFTADDVGKLGYFSVPVACDTLFCTFEATNKTYRRTVCTYRYDSRCGVGYTLQLDL